MSWKPNGQLEGRTVFSGGTLSYNKIIAEIIRREAEQIVQSAGKPLTLDTPTK